MNIKETGKQVVGRTARNRLAWSVYRACGRLSRSLGRVYGHAHFAREMGERDQRLTELISQMFPKPQVAAGPFKGMLYPSAQSFGSALLPKLLGSYESELHPFIEMLGNEYTSIVDIGCAEGYYAVGLGLKYATAQVYAFDVDLRARKLCAQLAEINGLNDRIHIGGFCDAAALKAISLGHRALIISDCEGYESTLFTSEAAAFLCKHDLIIETHDFINLNISLKIREAFKGTHQIRSVKSIDDIEKAHKYRNEMLDNHDLQTRRLAFGERRPAIMEWLVMTPKQQGAAQPSNC
jgi:hypothetical protein